MTSNSKVPQPTGNRLLDGLPPAEFASLSPLLELVDLPKRTMLLRAGDRIDCVYFPVVGVFSMTTTLDDGMTVEVATIGNEGIVGISAFLGSATAPLPVYSQIPGRALRAAVGPFRDAAAESPRLHDLLHRYTEALFVFTAQCVGCNRHHNIRQRCARWLLLTRDRVDGDEFPLTQEFLAQMLGVRRAGVNEVASDLQAAGLIRYQRGVITVLDRSGLEEASCECYRVIRNKFEEMLD